MEKKKLTIEGMHCASCASNIERSVRKIAGVTEVRVSVLTKTAFVESASPLSDVDLRKAVERAGYTLKEVKKV